jgi:hypothetical protein
MYYSPANVKEKEFVDEERGQRLGRSSGLHNRCSKPECSKGFLQQQAEKVIHGD